MGDKKRIEFLVVDTSAFINNAALQEIGENIITATEVVNEVKSKRQLRRLIVLPYDLQVKDVHPENIKFVNEFSKKTGDFTSLSATDTTVVALTYQLEKEKNGTDHLNATPTQKPTIEPFHTVPDDLTNVVGFHIPKKHGRIQSASLGDPCENDSGDSEDERFDDAKEEFEFDRNSGEENGDKLCQTLNKVIEGNEMNCIKHSNYDDDDDDDGDSDSDWITPNNVEVVKNKIADELVEDYGDIRVACLTTDYAMQNVLKQIGLNVVSLDGKIIKELRTFILRCYGCFKTTSIMNKVFCPNCGNKTLKKVAVSLNADGTQHLHINFRKPLTARGKRFSLPRPKGGKHSNNPILCEDQPVPQQKPSRLSRTKNNPLNDDYIAGYSPFVMRDVTSKSAMLGIKPHIELKHSTRRNPNECRRQRR
ncbi:hypothetical protein RUM43_009595 [Polyplax serrata]|uniref:RNA-binding protein NOB1 n=1 Tax=Polyplax serrata TaxID=468196 RepID=A0AAN8NWC4_POLSC